MSDAPINDPQSDIPEESVHDQILRAVEEHLDEDRYERALELLYAGLRRPEFDIRIYEKAAFVLRMSGNHEAAELFEKVLTAREDPEAYFRLGYQLVQDGVFGPALGPLSHCVELAPEAAAANYEFAYALMKEFYNDEALHFFGKAFEQEQAMSITFYISQLLIFLNRADEAAHFVAKLKEQVNESGGDGEMQLAYLKEMLHRYQTYKPKNIRDWHFVQYGTLLLRTFEDDYPDAENSSNGRYALVNFSYEMIASVLAAFQSAITPLEVFPEYRYVAAAGEASAPLAHALSNMLMVPVRPLEQGLAAGEQGIVISAFSDELNEIGGQVWERDDVLLFSFALSWTHELNVLPEVIGYFAQASRLPWQQKIEFDENGEPVMVPADARPAEEIARDILDRAVQVDAQWVEQVGDYFKQREQDIIAGRKVDVPRKKFFVHSALGGARY